MSNCCFAAAAEGKPVVIVIGGVAAGMFTGWCCATYCILSKRTWLLVALAAHNLGLFDQMYFYSYLSRHINNLVKWQENKFQRLDSKTAFVAWGHRGYSDTL